MDRVQSASGLKKYNNGRRHTPAVKELVRRLRGEGLTHREIAQQLGISLGSVHLWTIDIKLTSQQQKAIQERRNSKRSLMGSVSLWTVEQRKEIGERLRPYQFKKQHTKQSLIKEIQEFHQRKGRMPLKKEFNSRRSFRNYFGSWNNAIRAAGFDPNPEYFTKRVRAEDGHICDSFTEATIDNWLSAHKISHERNRGYPGSRMTADFYVMSKELFIEYFGLKGVNRKYDKNFSPQNGFGKKVEFKLFRSFR